MPASTTFAFLLDTLRTEREKTLSVWAMCDESDLDVRPRPDDRRGRTLREHMTHQCVSENGWFANMLGIAVTTEPVPPDGSRLAFLRRYAADSAARLAALAERDDAWWSGQTTFFGVERSRAWVVVRRIAHTAHHRGQQTALLRALGRPLHSVYGPTADTGGLAKDAPPVVYPYPDPETLLREEADARRKAALPPPVDRPVTERPST
jgi:uncharacterized damage-inducible protein DinB